MQFVSLIHPAISVDIEILRDCYESFAMYCFGRYLVACLGMFSVELFVDFVIQVVFVYNIAAFSRRRVFLKLVSM